MGSVRRNSRRGDIRTCDTEIAVAAMQPSAMTHTAGTAKIVLHRSAVSAYSELLRLR